MKRAWSRAFGHFVNNEGAKQPTPETPVHSFTQQTETPSYGRNDLTTITHSSGRTGLTGFITHAEPLCSPDQLQVTQLVHHASADGSPLATSNTLKFRLRDYVFEYNVEEKAIKFLEIDQESELLEGYFVDDGYDRGIKVHEVLIEPFRYKDTTASEQLFNSKYDELLIAYQKAKFASLAGRQTGHETIVIDDKGDDKNKVNVKPEPPAPPVIKRKYFSVPTTDTLKAVLATVKLHAREAPTTKSKIEQVEALYSAGIDEDKLFLNITNTIPNPRAISSILAKRSIIHHVLQLYMSENNALLNKTGHETLAEMISKNRTWTTNFITLFDGDIKWVKIPCK